MASPREFAQSVAAADAEQRRRLRADALQAFLEQPQAATRLRLELIYDASMPDPADARDGCERLDEVLADAELDTVVRAELTTLRLRCEQRLASFDAIEGLGGELADARAENARLRNSNAELQAAGAEARRELSEAEEKLRALLSIEQQSLEEEVRGLQDSGGGGSY